MKCLTLIECQLKLMLASNQLFLHTAANKMFTFEICLHALLFPIMQQCLQHGHHFSFVSETMVDVESKSLLTELTPTFFIFHA